MTADWAVQHLRERLAEKPRWVTGADGVPLTVGGRAQVLRYVAPVAGEEPSPLDEGWAGPWTQQHEDSVNAFRGIIAIYLPGNGVVLDNGLSYPPSCLVNPES